MSKIPIQRITPCNQEGSVSKIECFISETAKTAKAIMITHNDVDHWLPLSCIHMITHQPSETEPGFVTIDSWVLKKKGLL
jgi:predicted metallo-beta-lactamase superfamily hydrolase